MADTFTLADATLKVIQDRRSIREYKPDPVSNEDLNLILEAARQAPSGENAQPWRFIVVKRRRYAEETWGYSRGWKQPQVYSRICNKKDAGTFRQP